MSNVDAHASCKDDGASDALPRGCNSSSSSSSSSADAASLFENPPAAAPTLGSPVVGTSPELAEPAAGLSPRSRLLPAFLGRSLGATCVPPLWSSAPVPGSGVATDASNPASGRIGACVVAMDDGWEATGGCSAATLPIGVMQQPEPQLCDQAEASSTGGTGNVAVTGAEATVAAAALGSGVGGSRPPQQGGTLRTDPEDAPADDTSAAPPSSEERRRRQQLRQARLLFLWAPGSPWKPPPVSPEEGSPASATASGAGDAGAHDVLSPEAGRRVRRRVLLSPAAADASTPPASRSSPRIVEGCGLQSSAVLATSSSTPRKRPRAAHDSGVEQAIGDPSALKPDGVSGCA